MVRLLPPLLALLGALVFTTLILVITGTPPLVAYQAVFFGAFRDLFRPTPGYRGLADAAMLAAPLLLCAAGLTLSFAAGLYNLGVEGQMALGGVFAMAVMRLFADLPPPLLWALAFAAGALGGALWAGIAAALKIYGRVSEIFAGLGLNFLATGVALYLVFGPWKRPGIASMSGTEPLADALRLPTWEPTRFAPLAAVVALLAIALVWFLLTRTRWGLSVRATGLNPAAAERLGVPAVRRLVQALCGCGALAGLGGAVQVLAVFHALIPNISSGIGLLALLVVLLVRASPTWVLPVTLAFACFTVGSIQLSTANIDSSISGVLQGALVLCALAARGFSSK
ncbi:MAG: ABC transporter permease [Chloroflexaceae bacterium]|nr:ABC transporter permease [Chloroflexaceae bacterium]